MEISIIQAMLISLVVFLIAAVVIMSLMTNQLKIGYSTLFGREKEN